MDLSFKKYGDQGQPLLILHGVFGMLDNWHSLSKKLSHHHVVYSIDLRNHGQSPHNSEMTYEVMASDVAKLIKKEKLDQVILLGHSMGGKVAMKFATMYPDALLSLIIADIAPKRYKPGHLKIFKALKAIDFRSIKSRKEANKALADCIPDHGLVYFLMKNLTRHKDGSYGLKMNLEAIENAYDEIIGEITFDWPLSMPTLFLKGGDSNYVTEEDEHEIEKWFSNVEFDEVDEAGHWLHADHPEMFLEKVKSFIAKQ
jgi:esterase